MNDRVLARFGAMAIAIAVMLPATVSSAGQTRSAPPADRNSGETAKWTPPRTPDGRPDLQGVWLIRTATPLERPKALEGRQSLTAEEVVALRERADRLFNSGNSDFAAGDNVFLAALANVEHYKNPNATHGAVEMVEREFDNRTSLIVDPPDGRLPPYTPAGQRRKSASDAADIMQNLPAGPEDLTNYQRCITFGVPMVDPGQYSYFQVVQTRDYVVIIMEAIHDARIIPLDGRPHLPRSIRKWSGDSLGRWEGKTLVVDTTNFSPKSNFRGSAENLHLVERLTRVAPDTIDYEITVDDLTTWTKPWTAVVRLKQSQNQLYEVACHEGNLFTMQGILAGARAEEKAAEEAAKKRLK